MSLMTAAMVEVLASGKDLPVESHHESCIHHLHTGRTNSDMPNQLFPSVTIVNQWMDQLI